MKTLKNVKLGTKMAFGFAIPLVIMMAVIAVVFGMVNTMESDAALAKNESAVFTRIARQMKLADIMERSLQTYILYKLFRHIKFFRYHGGIFTNAQDMITGVHIICLRRAGKRMYKICKGILIISGSKYIFYPQQQFRVV